MKTPASAFAMCVVGARAAMADEDALRVFAQVVAVTGTGLPERSGDSLSIHY